MMAFGLNYNPDGLIFDVALRSVLNIAEAPQYDWVHTLLVGVVPLEVELLIQQAVRKKKLYKTDVESFLKDPGWEIFCIYIKQAPCTLANIRFVPQLQQR